MKFLKPIVILFLLFSTVLSGGCGHTKEDQERIIRYLDNRFGKDTYTIKQDESYYRWFVTLNQYPDLTVYYTVSRDPLSMTSPSITTNFDEVFSEHAVEEYKKTHALGDDDLVFDDSIDFVYHTKVKSLEELKVPYDRAMGFIAFVSEKYPVLVDEGLLNIRMDITGIRLKGADDDDTLIFQHISKAKKDGLSIVSYEEICRELAPKLKTHADNPDGFTFHADIGKSFILGSDTFGDCLHKNLILENGTPEELDNIILQPGEISRPYIFKSESRYEFTTITLQAENVSDSPCSLPEATIIKAVIDDAKEIYVDPVRIDLAFDERREWKDPYEMLGISPPETEEENAEGVPYKNIKILFTMNKYYKGVRRVTLTFNKHTG